MNVYAWVLLVAAAVAAVADWWAVATGRRAVEQLAKPAYVVLLAVLAWLLHAEQSATGVWLLVALAACLVGDILMLGDSDRAFLGGLVAFLLAHLALLGAVLTTGRRDPIWLGVVLTVLVVVAVGWWLLRPLVGDDPSEGVPPLVYAVVIGVFVAAAWWSGHVLVGAGATLFLVSDGVLAVGRFRRAVPGGPVVVIVTHHLALLLLVLGLLRPDLVGR